MLSYKVELSSTSSSGGTLSLSPYGSSSGIIYMAFSVIIITQNTNNIQKIVLTKTGLSTGSDPTYYLNSSKFNFNTNSDQRPTITHFYQWVTAGYSYSSYFTYWTRAQIDVLDSSSSSELSVKIYAYSPYLTGFKLIILLVSKTIGSQQTAQYSTRFQEGSVFDEDDIFNYNLAVPTNIFGQPATGRSCIHGFYLIGLRYSSTSSQFVFNFNGK